ncbi:hypothetical protein CCACVL1_07102 [Corchorus capsularis]|uniref:DUF4283 domain-containing protein n=1 Tax=Corchorus capsularis TaxID=210143 RepID=A0A1R3J9G6_COCAP|nr:hypothetical protein CCACVL1_07102 [Corchorus capsularis]
MADNLSNLCSQLSLQEGEQSEPSKKIVIAKEWIDEPEGSLSWFSLLAKLFSKKQANVEGLRIAMFQAWKPDMGMRVKAVEDNLFLFEFEDGVDRDRIMVSQPWSFQRSLIILNDYDGFTLPDEVEFDAFPLWILAFGLPPAMQMTKVVMAIGQSFGLVQDVDLSEGRFMRVRVEMDIKTPIQIDTTVTTPDGDDIEVKFKYEKTPDFCRVCGIVVHQEQDCPTTVEQKKLQGFVVRKFTSDLKVESPIVKSRGIDRLGSPSFSLGSFSSSRALSHDRRSRFDNTGLRFGARGERSLQGSESRFRQYIDSLALHGRSVARDIDGVSCEIISRLPERGREKGKVRLEEEEVSSAQERPIFQGKRDRGDNGNGSYRRGQNNEENDHGLGYSPTAPGLGIEMRNLGQVAGLGHRGVGSVIKPGIQRQMNKETTPRGQQLRCEETEVSSADSSTFVFGSGSTPTKGAAKGAGRRWKKMDRVSSRYTLEALSQEPVVHQGKRRRNIGPCAMSIDGSGAKKSREHEEGQGESTGSQIAPRQNDAVEGERDNHQRPVAEMAGENHLC